MVYLETRIVALCTDVNFSTMQGYFIRRNYVQKFVKIQFLSYFKLHFHIFVFCDWPERKKQAHTTHTRQQVLIKVTHAGWSYFELCTSSVESANHRLGLHKSIVTLCISDILLVPDWY